MLKCTADWRPAEISCDINSVNGNKIADEIQCQWMQNNAFGGKNTINLLQMHNNELWKIL